MADLTETNIKAAIDGDVLRDAEIRGLHLRCFPTKKAFYLYYRTKAGQERRPKLGTHGTLTLTQARKAARELLAKVAVGGDPQGQYETARNEPTVSALWEEFWKRRGAKLKAAEWDKALWLRFIEPKLGNRRLSSVAFTDADDLHKAMRGTPIQANRMLAVLSKLFNYAHSPLKWTAKGHNPCEGVERFKERKRKRHASREEVARLVDRLRAELDGPNTATAAFIFLLLLTGARKGEIAAARWPNLQGNRILLDEHKTDDGGYARIIYVPPAGMDIIERYLPRTASGTITGVQSPTKLWQRIRREEKLVHDGEYLTLHDLRRTFASVALSTGKVSLEQVMQMLGHTSAQTTKVYAHLMQDAAIEAVNLVAEHMEQKRRPAP